MEDIIVEGDRSIISISTKDRFLSEGRVLLGFRYHGDNSRTTTMVTEDDLDAIMEAIIKYKRTKKIKG